MTRLWALAPLPPLPYVRGTRGAWGALADVGLLVRQRAATRPTPLPALRVPERRYVLDAIAVEGIASLGGEHDGANKHGVAADFETPTIAAFDVDLTELIGRDPSRNQLDATGLSALAWALVRAFQQLTWNAGQDALSPAGGIDLVLAEFGQSPVLIQDADRLSQEMIAVRLAGLPAPPANREDSHLIALVYTSNLDWICEPSTLNDGAVITVGIGRPKRTVAVHIDELGLEVLAIRTLATVTVLHDGAKISARSVEALLGSLSRTINAR